MEAVNPVVEQDRAEDLLDNWRKYGYVMFPQQRQIYELIAKELAKQPYVESVLEAGCGSGQGAAVLSYLGEKYVLGTDKVRKNCDFAKCLYPWMDFEVWDVSQPHGLKFDAVVAVEVIEHVADPQAAIRNLINAARYEVWISTPNGKGKPRPPENPCHVCEYTIREMLLFLDAAGVTPNQVAILGWEDLKPVSPDTDVSPLVYRIKLR